VDLESGPHHEMDSELVAQDYDDWKAKTGSYTKGQSNHSAKEPMLALARRLEERSLGS
jgi:hypothetical protein